jgi:hypothetical protein
VGTHSITAAYSGNATFAAATAGPLAETVKGSTSSSGSTTTTALTLTIGSSSYSSLQGQAVKFTVKVSGGQSPTGAVAFTDNGASIAGCSGVALSSGIATCTTSSLAVGSHAIRGNYSGDANNGAGVAGPITQTVK